MPDFTCFPSIACPLTGHCFKFTEGPLLSTTESGRLPEHRLALMAKRRGPRAEEQRAASRLPVRRMGTAHPARTWTFSRWTLHPGPNHESGRWEVYIISAARRKCRAGESANIA